MRRPSAISKIASRVFGFAPDQGLHFELVRSLYNATSTPKAIVSATIAALIVVATAGLRSGDGFYAIFFLAFALVGAARTYGSWLYHKTQHDPDNLDAIKHWELRALTGAWTFAGFVGLTGGYTLWHHAGTDIEILINCCVIGYVAGISARNASRPVVVIGQVSFTCVPFITALALRMDIVHGVLAAFITVLFAGTILVSRSVFENIVLRHEAFKHIERLARRDALTGLWNRGAFLDLVASEFEPVIAGHKEIALISIDLDRFKDINDTLGHPVGDTVLIQVAERIKSVLEAGDEVSRIGGDEFLVMLAGQRALNVQSVADDIMGVLADPFFAKETRTICGASIGYAVAPRDGATLDTLMRNADLALYEAKKRGRAQVVGYTALLSLHYDKRVALEHDLQFALSNGELAIEYQPIVDPRSGRVISCEALLRWHHPVLGNVAPSIFIPVAEATGLIVPIGTWVLTTACAEATCWDSDVKVAVNLSAIQFRRGREIVDVVKTVLSETGLPPSRLDLEITETVLLDDSVMALSLLEELRAHGVGISLDDFGTGFASLAYLNDFPFTKIKIDRKFVQDLDASPRTFAIIKGISQIARDLRIERVAEGIETIAQLERMQSFGINAIQGYVYSRPVPAGVLRDLIKTPIAPVGQDDMAAIRSRIAS